MARGGMIELLPQARAAFAADIEKMHRQGETNSSPLGTFDVGMGEGAGSPLGASPLLVPWVYFVKMLNLSKGGAKGRTNMRKARPTAHLTCQLFASATTEVMLDPHRTDKWHVYSAPTLKAHPISQGS